MSLPARRTARVRFSFEDFELDTTTYELRRGGTAVPMEPQVFDVLAHLVRAPRPGRVEGGTAR